MTLAIQQSLKDDALTAPMTRLFLWFEVLRRTVYYKPNKIGAEQPIGFHQNPSFVTTTSRILAYFRLNDAPTNLNVIAELAGHNTLRPNENELQ